jgi:hypothetical protein
LKTSQDYCSVKEKTLLKENTQKGAGSTNYFLLKISRRDLPFEGWSCALQRRDMPG